MPASSLPPIEGRKKTTGGDRRVLTPDAPVLVPVNETKLAIVAVMRERDRPVSSIELRKIWAEDKALEIFEYHLVTLVKAKVAEVAYGPELHFRLTAGRDGRESLTGERCR
jgi:hypothetical protein